MTESKTTSVSKTIIINAPASKVWDTLTKPKLMKLWMSDGEIEIISDWKIGSPFVIHSNVNGKHEYKGEILQLELVKVFQYSSWSKISKLPDTSENYSLIEFKLEPYENKTTLSITHNNLIAKAAVEHSNFFWNIALQEIKKMCEN
jgi:uncharacterized protein YndB with AHSA1/START domain